MELFGTLKMSFLFGEKYGALYTLFIHPNVNINMIT